jgi:hypothetical protein
LLIESSFYNVGPINPVVLSDVKSFQDLPDAISPEEVADALDLGSIPSSKHKVQVLGTQTPPNSQTRHPSIAEVEHALLVMSSDN